MEIEEGETAGICRAEYGKEGNYMEKQFLKPTLVFAWILNCVCVLWDSSRLGKELKAEQFLELT